MTQNTKSGVVKLDPKEQVTGIDEDGNIDDIDAACEKNIT